LEWCRRNKNGSRFPVIHNYGHCAKGIAQHWGCAEEVVKLAKQAFYLTPNL